MKEKIRKFLSNGKVQLVEFCVLAATSAGLILGGQNVEGIDNVISLVGGAVTAIGAIVTAISSLVKEK